MIEYALVVMMMTQQGKVEPVVEGKFRSQHACNQAKREYEASGNVTFGVQCLKVDKN
jgi:hypothetical protein